jgi:hypothetical protein
LDTEWGSKCFQTATVQVILLRSAKFRVRMAEQIPRCHIRNQKKGRQISWPTKVFPGCAVQFGIFGSSWTGPKNCGFLVGGNQRIYWRVAWQVFLLRWGVPCWISINSALSTKQRLIHHVEVFSGCSWIRYLFSIKVPTKVIHAMVVPIRSVIHAMVERCVVSMAGIKKFPVDFLSQVTLELLDKTQFLFVCRSTYASVIY